jgi:hypothetical protein
MWGGMWWGMWGWWRPSGWATMMNTRG